MAVGVSLCLVIRDDVGDIAKHVAVLRFHRCAAWRYLFELFEEVGRRHDGAITL